MHVKEGENRKPKAKLKSKKTCKPSITKSIGEERLIHRGIKKLSFLKKKKEAPFRNNCSEKKVILFLFYSDFISEYCFFSKA